MQAYTIRLSINEDLKLEKAKKKKGSATRSYIRSSNYVATATYQVLPSSASAVITLRLLRQRFKLKDKDKPRVNLKYLVYYTLV